MLYLSRLLLSICGIANIQHCALVVASPSGSEPTAQVQNSVDEKYFEQKVRPIFEAKCLNCHGPKQQKSSYRIDVREIAIKGGDHGESAIIPGRSQESRLFEYVSSEETDFRMPPKESNLARLNQVEIEVIRQWIDRGAIWPDSANVTIADPLDWWSFKPLRKVPVPDGYSNPIDAFINLKLSENNLSMSPAADPRTLGRRLFFDLIGLPPTPEELDEFERASKIDSMKALDRLVESLLASPHYGERWARHWLDVVHYGDTHGYDKDKPRPNAWPYRDYVIRSFNEDKPYVRFIQEQIAGDQLAPVTRDGMEALGFIAAGPWDFIGHAEVPETKIDGKIARHLDRDDMVANTMGTFCSITVHCAQCHQHKFDPITQEDYYSLQSVFAALDRTELRYYPDHATNQKFQLLERTKNEVSSALSELEKPLRSLAGESLVTLTKKIEEASKEKGKQANSNPEFGYHSGIASTQDEVKWVQVDLGKQIDIKQVTLLPCYDDFNSIGAGFGFPIRFRVEASDDPEFRFDVKLLRQLDDRGIESDMKNPGMVPLAIKVENAMARYVRVTATKLATRQNDYIFALAELEIADPSEKNVAVGCNVTAKDSTEAGPRWQKRNLTDGIAPKSIETDDRESLIAAREVLIESFADESTKKRRRELIAKKDSAIAELKGLPSSSLVYAAAIHHGSGTFRGTGPDGGKPRPIFLLTRGQVTQPGPLMSPGALSAFRFQPSKFEISMEAPEGERRLALAHWISNADNPLTWRSIVNRVWQYHFGRGFVDTPNDLGRNGGLPSHPELLDWLAVRFRDEGGSLKQLHRWIVKSKAYQQSSTGPIEYEKIDSNNALLWRQNRRRLEAEALRDAVLVVSGKLDKSMGGPGWQDFVVEHPEHSPHYEYALANPEDATTWRRSVYRFIVRSQTQPWMTSLDCADPSQRVDKRNESLSSIQALALLNNGFMLTQSKHFAKRLEQESDDIEFQVERAYRIALGSPPSDASRLKLVEFARENGLPYLCRLLFNLNAFTFVD